MKQNELLNVQEAQQIVYADIVLSAEEMTTLAEVMQEICMRLEWVETSLTWLDMILGPYFHIYSSLCDDPYMERFANIIRAFYILRSQLNDQICDRQIAASLFHYFLANDHPIRQSDLQLLKQQLQEHTHE